MHLLHRLREVGCGIDLAECFVKGHERVVDRALSFDRDEFRYRLLGDGKAIALHLIEGSYIGFSGPDGRLGYLRCGAGHEQRKKEVKKQKGRQDASAWKHRKPQ